ncbi:MAG: YkvA family protein [Geitlerinemataceae cyanobacterium]
MKFSIESIYTWYRNTIRNPKYRWWVILGTLLYFVSPIDIAPDFIPGIGQLDDVFLLTLLVTEVSQMAIEGFKKKKGQGVDSTPNATETVTESATERTVEVGAVPVE